MSRTINEPGRSSGFRSILRTSPCLRGLPQRRGADISRVRSDSQFNCTTGEYMADPIEHERSPTSHRRPRSPQRIKLESSTGLVE